MIKNQRQYEMTRAQVAEFERALAEMDPSDERLHPLLRKAKGDALQSQLDELRAELIAYEALQSGAIRVLELTNFTELPTALIRARIAARLSQKELAERLGIKEQQIQRYEATNYAGASLDRIREVMSALGVAVREEIYLPGTDITWRGLLQGARKMGLEPGWIERLLPSGLLARLTAPDEGEDAPGLVLRAAALLGRVFHVRPIDFFTGSPGQLTLAGAGGVRFKLPARAGEVRVTAYTTYAHYLALVVLEAAEDLEAQSIPTDPKAVSSAIRERYGSITFHSVLLYVWELGVAVLPLQGPGGFHGACWRERGRNVIVLKQSTRSSARWAFDLLHELRHAAERPDETEFGVIEEVEIAAELRTSEEELVASQFAGEVALDGKAESLAQRCVTLARGSIERLTSVVPPVAREANVSVGMLANYMAFRLSLQGERWWGAAQNLQETDEDPWEIARDELLKRVDFGRLAEPDRDLLLQALTTPEV